LILAFFEYAIGVPLGGMLGYFGGKFDIYMQRLIEIWSSLPTLFLIIIVASIVRPNFILLIILLSLVRWVGITTLMRAEFYREKAKDYVAAAVSIGVPTHKIMLKHILPNSLVPIITYFPFSIVAGIAAPVFDCCRDRCTGRIGFLRIRITAANAQLGTDDERGIAAFDQVVAGDCSTVCNVFDLAAGGIYWRGDTRSLRSKSLFTVAVTKGKSRWQSH